MRIYPEIIELLQKSILQEFESREKLDGGEIYEYSLPPSYLVNVPYTISTLPEFYNPKSYYLTNFKLSIFLVNRSVKILATLRLRSLILVLTDIPDCRLTWRSLIIKC